MSKIISLVVLQAIFCFTLSYSDNALIETTCRKTPFPDLCLSILKSDPRSSTMNMSGLARIVVDNVKGKATATMNQIGALITSSANDPSLKKVLGDCFASYKTILQGDIPIATEAITKGTPKFVVGSATDAAKEARKCGNGIAEKLPNSPISGDNKAVHDLSIVLKSIATLLLSGYDVI